MNECNCLNCLKKATIFQYLSHEELAIINETRHEARYNPGEIILKQGTAMTHLMSFQSGLAKVYIEGLNRKNLILRFIQPEEFVGGPGLFTDSRHHFTVSAIEESKVCFINLETYKQVLNGNNNFAIHSHKNANMITLKSFEKFISLTQKQMPGRIADALLYIAKDIYKAHDFETKISRQDIADLTAMTKESAIRILKQFKDDKIIQLDGNHFKVLDMEELERISRTG